jgi:hypothetical protein
MYPQVPTGYELGINCAVLSYCGKLFFGLIADAQVAPDVSRLRDFLYVAFHELCVDAGVRKRERPPAARGKTRARRPKPAEAKAPALRARARRAKPAGAEAPPVPEAAPEPPVEPAPPPAAMSAAAGR